PRSNRPGSSLGATAMRRWIIAGALMIGSAMLARSAWTQQPGNEGRPRQPGPGEAAGPLLSLFDTDRDGTLSATEIDAAATRRRERDANKDGKLTADELRRGPGGRGGRGGGPGRGGAAMEPAADPSKPLLPKDDGERRILAALDQARQGRRYANVSTA